MHVVHFRTFFDINNVPTSALFDIPVQDLKRAGFIPTSVVGFKSEHFVTYVRDPHNGQWWFLDALRSKIEKLDANSRIEDFLVYPGPQLSHFPVLFIFQKAADLPLGN